MLSRLSASAALLAAWLAVSPALHACPPAEKLVPVTYPVLDLIMPAPDYTCPASTEKTDKPKNAVAVPTREGWLIELIQNTIEPSTWVAKGGQGTIDYFPLSGALIINHTPKVQQQVADFLANLRKLKDTEVALEVRIITIAEDDCERLGVDFNQKAKDAPLEMKFLTDKDVGQLVKSVAGCERTSICQSPQLMLANEQSGTVSMCDYPALATVTRMQLTTLPNGAVTVCPVVKEVETGCSFTAKPVVSADRRSVHLSLDFHKKDLNSELHFSITAMIPDGGTVMCGGLQREVEVRQECGEPLFARIPYLNRLFKTIGYGRESQRVMVLVTPRIVKDTEEAPAPQATAVGACAGSGAVVGGAIGAAEDHAEYKRRTASFEAATSENTQRQADVLARLLKAYNEACAEGNTAEAQKYAQAALLIDPTCFSKK